MSSSRPELSILVPTRGRAESLLRFLLSLAATTSRPAAIEVVLAIDSDDAPPPLPKLPFELKTHFGPPGRTMGELNAAACSASRGDFIMLMNDDVIVRSHGWDRLVRRAIRRFPDRLVLVHVNDTLIRDHLCAFPILSRTCIEVLGGLASPEYERYRIDDHLQDPFDMLARVGVRRTVYLPDAIFEHRNSVNHPEAGAVYESDPAILNRDAPRFEAMLPERKAAAVRLLERIEGRLDPAKVAILESIDDSFALRVPGRQIVLRSPLVKRLPGIAGAILNRLAACYRRGGAAGLVKAAIRRAT